MKWMQKREALRDSLVRAAGFLAGFGWAALSFSLIGLFERRTLKYMLINGGFITLCFTLAGFILGIWR